MNEKTTHTIMGSFLGAIIVGSILLALPICSSTGKAVPYIDCLFTATTAVCVTGLVTVSTAGTWSIWGQLVILMLIQIGGLGIITILTGVMIGIHRRIGLSDRLLLLDVFNLNSLSGIIGFTKKVILGTFFVEGMGALLCMPVFVAQFGVRGIWVSVFHAVSAFCNAGMDVIGENSLCDYMDSPVIMLVTMLLIVLGGLGFVVWWDILRVRRFRKLTFHSKLALTSTVFLLLFGTLVFFFIEKDQPASFGTLPLWQKWMAAAFQSVTVRTAGFAAVAQENFTDASSLIALLLMFIGGSPVGTAGGVKTVTFLVVFASAFATIQNREDVCMFGRTVPRGTVRKAVAVLSMSFAISFVSAFALMLTSHAGTMDILYEAISATATVGLSRGLTGTLGTAGKLIVIATMYLGRVGPISLAVAFGTKKAKVMRVKNPQDEISVG